MYDNDKMKNKLTQWIINDQQAFTVIENSSFIEFVHSLSPNAWIPSADTIKRNIYNLYETNIKKIKDILQTVLGKISFTTDIWISSSNKSFLSLTAHFIDRDWRLQSVIIDFLQIHGSHTGESIKDSFIFGVENLSIKNKVIINFKINVDMYTVIKFIL
jgi:hypothetical protein